MSDEEMLKVMEVCKNKEIPCDDCPLVEYRDCEEISRQYFYDRFKELESENSELRAKLEKAVDLPRIIHPNENEWFIQYQLKIGIIDYSIRYSKEAAEACLAELKGEKR